MEKRELIMKAYTDLEQSKKLEKILPLETADMFYVYDRHLGKLYGDIPYVIGYKVLNENVDIPCWSLAALLDILQKTAYFIDEDANVVLCSYKTVEWNLGINNSDVEFTTKTNSIDACYEIILKLHELNLL